MPLSCRSPGMEEDYSINRVSNVLSYQGGMRMEKIFQQKVLSLGYTDYESRVMIYAVKAILILIKCHRLGIRKIEGHTDDIYTEQQHQGNNVEPYNKSYCFTVQIFFKKGTVYEA